MVIPQITHRWRGLLRRLLHTPLLRTPIQLAGSFAMGFVLSGASLLHQLQPVAMAVLCAGLPGWLALPYVLGSCLGFRLLWGQAGMQGLVWLAAALPTGVLLADRCKRLPLLQPAVAALIVSASGVAFQFWQGDDTTVWVYILRVALAFGATLVFCHMRRHRQTPADWIGSALLVLGLAQLAPLPYLNLGLMTAAFLAPAMPFPAAVLTGLALDFSQVTQVPMTAVLALSCLLRLLPGGNKRLSGLWPGLLYGPVMVLWGVTDLYPLPALAAGCLGAVLLPIQPARSLRRGDTGLAQVRLEMAAGVLAQTEALLQQVRPHPIDEEALIQRAAQRACGGCSLRAECGYMDAASHLPTELLSTVQLDGEDLPVGCRKHGRLLSELRRSQEQLRLLRADRRRQQEYRSAVAQQYRFLSAYLQEVADKLPRPSVEQTPCFRAEVAASTAGRSRISGDRCCWFAGTEYRYYVLLCDGMGTGADAAENAQIAGNMLRKLLIAGLPASFALRSLNSLCTLQGRAGAVTVDLAELNLINGKATLYKWGAAPSYLLTGRGPQRVGIAGAPPGLSVTREQETVTYLQLRRGQALILFSDGVAAEYAVEELASCGWEPAATMASRLLERGKGTDDATVAVIRLQPLV